ncbi:Gfo/Idh/MocA family protein [Nocardia cyriacigeorgica]|uniref:Gfo/Idh/MocA family protein n=1 Tax=Nocardia cyriacigeorgica TaxID=135487 RepID=UPI0018950738|nr:Gfo/Idh/MocA family oxidoreductase [Nocardia cyriacigeorgica]MBF6413572.1 Gfo/Idh/MocA family oxidoreductase [Nocardia cyriacigeorgica]
MRIGIVGLLRGLYMGEWAERIGLEVVAICDRDAERLAQARATFSGARACANWADLLDAGLDGVILANDFDAHAELAMAFLGRGVHVLSETAACASEQEGRELIAAAERSAATYSFAENYVFHPHTRLVRESVASGELGAMVAVEADYLHSLSPEDTAGLIGDPAHWRGRIAPTAYCTHTVSPVLSLTGAWPVDVSAFPVGPRGDRAAAVVLVIRLSDGTLAIARHGFLAGEPDSHWSWISVRGVHGLTESLRASGESAWSVRVRTEGWARPDGRAHEEIRRPRPHLMNDEPVDRMAEGTVVVLEGFRATIEHGAVPLIPVRAAVAASLVGVTGAQSLGENGRPVPVPDVSA